MTIRHLFLALLVIAIWGCNFIFIKLSVNEIPPLFLCAIRFFLAAFPAFLFVKRPAIPFRIIASYGLFMFGLQFALIFTAISLGMTPGLASLLLQVQIFFSIFFAKFTLHESPSAWQVMGAFVSFAGISLVALHLDSHIPLISFIFMIGAAASWGVGNLLIKKTTAVQINMIGLVVWGSLIACLPLLLLAFLFEGPTHMAQSLYHLSGKGLFSILYIVYASTWVGYGIWNWLLSRYPVATIAPFTLLVPFWGMLSSAAIFKEPLQPWKLIAALLVIIGLCVNLLGGRFFEKRSQTEQTNSSTNPSE